ncbi:hypothetical protein MPTK1_5g12260 [Marchantia polymorpha subsp. ruderalis]|nr:hypothetical protein MARPO_0092s0080 [Marchantia polymorpha]BBN11482.1 hypothetical protein Mp_5g12260 [Marchantia polymorpha subsp. ruderalis]|eukprot:PTQ33119.1 hypothetical protein MARPO_0092s0080 [Marchantia polymorpha]
MTSKQVPHFQAENPMKSAQLFMTKGTGAMSYAENSNWHAMCMEKIWPTVLELVDSMKLPDDDMSIITIADLGCAPGRNTINNVETVLKRVKERYRNGHIPEFQAFFQDLYDTDFNTLFQLFKNSVATIAENVPETLKYFPAGVPGSFYGRVFPRSSVHFVMSTFALHWISKVPSSVLDKTSEDYNGGKIEHERASRATIDAYARQGDVDLRNFLDARVEEMATGGLMLLVFGVRKVYYPYCNTMVNEVKERIWDELVSEGKVDSGLRGSFNNFMHFHYLKDVEQILNSYSEKLIVEKEYVFPFFLYPQNMTAREKAARHASLNRGLYTSMLEDHFGEDITNLYIARYEQALLEGFESGTLTEDETNTYQFVAIVARKL